MFLVGDKISEVDSSFKRHLQDKPMEEISETWTKGCVKFAQAREVVLLIDPNGIHKNVMLEITRY